MISIIVPCYNGEKYIDRLFDCFDRQDSNDFEVVFVDDGSSDSSADLAKKRASEVAYACNIIKIKNGGVSHARNEGLKVAKGDFISFVDVDDIITSDRISFFKKCFESYDVDVVLTQMRRIENYDNTYYINEIEQKTILYSILNKKRILEAFLKETIKPGVCNGCFKRNLINKNNISFIEGCKYNEDLIFMWQLFVCTQKVCVTNKIDYYYMWVAGSAMSTFNLERLGGYVGMKNLYPFIEERAPEFATLFIRYAPARIMWSLCRQCSCKFSYHEFCVFFKGYDVDKEMRSLLSYNNFLVRLSALSYLLHPYLFYILANLQGRHNIHK